MKGGQKSQAHQSSIPLKNGKIGDNQMKKSYEMIVRTLESDIDLLTHRIEDDQHNRSGKIEWLAEMKKERFAELINDMEYTK